eukprot:2603299-Amphidinium_carterae.1
MVRADDNNVGVPGDVSGLFWFLALVSLFSTSLLSTRFPIRLLQKVRAPWGASRGYPMLPASSQSHRVGSTPVQFKMA